MECNSAARLQDFCGFKPQKIYFDRSIGIEMIEILQDERYSHIPYVVTNPDIKDFQSDMSIQFPYPVTSFLLEAQYILKWCILNDQEKFCFTEALQYIIKRDELWMIINLLEIPKHNWLSYKHTCNLMDKFDERNLVK